MPIFVVALAIPMVRTNSPMRDFCWAETCSTQDRTFDFSALALRVLSGFDLPGDFLRWIRLTKPLVTRCSSLAPDR